MSDVVNKAVIIGAGPAGLTAAHELAKHGQSVVVLEADPTYVGGISRTVTYNGFRFDIGGHRFFSKSREVEDLWTEILGPDLAGPTTLLENLLPRRVLFLSFEALRRALQTRALGIYAVRVVIRQGAAPSHTRSQVVRGLGGQPVRTPPVQHLLQDLHGKGLGHELPGDIRRLGGTAHQGPFAGLRHQERAPAATPAQRPEPGRQDLDRHVPLSAPRPGHDVGSVRGTGAEHSVVRYFWAAASPVAALTPRAALGRLPCAVPTERRSSFAASTSFPRCRFANSSRRSSRACRSRSAIRLTRYATATSSLWD